MGEYAFFWGYSLQLSSNPQRGHKPPNIEHLSAGGSPALTACVLLMFALGNIMFEL